MHMNNKKIFPIYIKDGKSAAKFSYSGMQVVERPSLCKTWATPHIVGSKIWGHPTFKVIWVSLHTLESTVLTTVTHIIQKLSFAPLQKHPSKACELHNGKLLALIFGQAACHVIKVRPLVQDWPRKSPPHSRFFKYCFLCKERAWDDQCGKSRVSMWERTVLQSFSCH